MILPLAFACSSADVTFATADPIVPADPSVVRFAALGDAGRGDAKQRRVANGVVHACAERGCDAIVLLGDLLYPRGLESDDDPRADAWITAPYAAAGAPLLLVLGNHDYGRGRDVASARRLLRWAKGRTDVVLPAHAWHLQAGSVHFVGLDTNAAFQFGDAPQRNWLAQVLDESDAPWEVVLGHHPFRSDGEHGNAGAYEGWTGLPIASGAALLRLYEGALCDRADLYLAGHDHNRQLLAHCDVDLVVSGAGSSTTPIVDRGNHPRFASAEPGFVWIELGEAGGRIVFLDADGRAEREYEIAP